MTEEAKKAAPAPSRCRRRLRRWLIGLGITVGVLMLLGGTVSFDHGTFVGDGEGALLQLTSGFVTVHNTAFVNAAVAVSGSSGTNATGDWNLFYGLAAIAGGTLTADQIQGSSSVDGEPNFQRWDAEAPCDALLAPAPKSPMVDAGDPDTIDGDASRADIGATGGEDGFILGADVDEEEGDEE